MRGPSPAPYTSPMQPIGEMSLRRIRVEQPTARELDLRVLRLALPVVGEQMLYLAVGTADMMIAGRIGEPELAGLGMATFLNWMMGLTFAAVGAGSTAVVARCVGAGDRRNARLAVRQSLLLGTLGGLILWAFNFFLSDRVFDAMGKTGEAGRFGAEWMRITTWAWVAQGITMVGSACLRGAGDTRTPLWIMAIVNSINVPLALLLTFGWGPLPATGAPGIAVATMAARIAGGLLTPWALSRLGGKLVVPLVPLTPDPVMIRRLVRVGLPAGGEMMMASIAMAAYYRIVATLGDTSMAAHGIAVRAEGLSYLPGYAFAVAASSMVGRYLGGGRPDLAERAARRAFVIGTGIMCGMALLFALAAEVIIGVFAPGQPDVVALAASALRLVALGQPGQAAAFIFCGALRGAGDTRRPMLITGLSLLAIRVPCAMLFCLHWDWGLWGAWMAMVLDLTIRGTLATMRFLTGSWKTTAV